MRGRVGEVVLAALYLRGGPRGVEVPRRGWAEVLAALRREMPEVGGAAAVLRRCGAALPAAVLETAGVLSWAEELVEAGKVLTAVSEDYPARWLETFGDLAPPAFWRFGADFGMQPTRWVGAVGSREVSREVVEYLEALGAQTGRLGMGIISGGAAGCDSAAERAALRAGAPVLRLLPHGMALRGMASGAGDDGATQLSLAAPNEPFSRALAMERNALIYGGAQLTVVGQARLRAGGTWHGATEALRRRLGPVLVRPDDSAAGRALRALGAKPLADPMDLGFALEATAPAQKGLFAFERLVGAAYG